MSLEIGMSGLSPRQKVTAHEKVKDLRKSYSKNKNNVDIIINYKCYIYILKCVIYY